MLPSPCFIQNIYLCIFIFQEVLPVIPKMGLSGVNFTEHDFLSDRGCSQPIFHGCSKQESSEQGSGDRCSLEDSEIDRKRKTTTDNGPHLSLAELQLSFLLLYHMASGVAITCKLFDRIPVFKSFCTSTQYPFLFQCLLLLLFIITFFHYLIHICCLLVFTISCV